MILKKSKKPFSKKPPTKPSHSTPGFGSKQVQVPGAFSSPSAKCLNSAQIEDLLRENQVQPTLQRMALARYVLCEADHPTAEDVHSWAEGTLGKISLATTYNTLNTLVAAGLLKMFRFPHSDKVFYDCNTHDHFHFYDEQSGAIIDLASEDFRISMNLPDKFSVRGMDLVVRGSIDKSKTETKPTKKRR